MNLFYQTHLVQDLNITEQNYDFNPNEKVLEFSSKQDIDFILPLILKTLCQKNQFITIIGSPRKLNKQWFEKHNLPLNKFVQIHSGKPGIQNMRLTLKALSSGKSSAVITWLSDICQGQFEQLMQAAIYGNSTAILLSPEVIYH